MNEKCKLHITNFIYYMSDIISLLKSVGAILTDDHFVLTSGKHSSKYINKDALYPHTELAAEVGRMFAEKYKDQDIDVVVGPMLGGIILSQWTAYHLTQLKGKEVLSVYTEKDAEGNQIFSRRGYDRFVTGKNALIVEDLTATGGSVKKVVNTVRSVGGNVIAVVVMVNRDPDNINSDYMEAPYDSLGVFPAEAIEEENCPYCNEGRPINTKIGHGKKYMDAKQSKKNV
jgi:orotate phosphoribosyltransferase